MGIFKKFKKSLDVDELVEQVGKDIYEIACRPGISPDELLEQTGKYMDEMARRTGISQMEFTRLGMLHQISGGYDPFAKFSEEQRRDWAKLYPDVAEAVRKKFGSQF